MKIGDQMLSLGIARDITERKMAEEALREQRDKAQKYLDVAGVMFVLLDAQGKVTLVNKKGCEILGCPEPEIVGRNWFETFLPERMRSTVEEVFHKLVAGETELVEYYENPVLTKGGTERIIAWHNTILKDDSGNIVGTLSSGQDITERKEAEQRAEEKQAELLHVSRLSTVGEMASGLAHELNQPLTAILTGSGLCLHNAREGVKNVDRLIENLQLIETQAERAGKIIHHLRTLIKRRDTSRTPVNINSTVREVADFMGSHVRHAEVALDLELSEQTPMVFADTIQIQQVLLNLMRNAIEAMEAVEPQTRRLTIRTSTSPDNDCIEVAVRDSGEGFACEDAETLFDSFFSTKPNGLGIGLSLCRSIVQAHQGRLWAKPNPDGGSTFAFTLPVAGDAL